ncbi:hypothetical protein CR162_10040 [Pseudoroseomonas rhizosphaerae]|uniref:VWFA domain-containing protein n=1 Tax=Teichococcus rhizosphaerae TaxID=1335062 RepID=A0A2C6Z9A1_9PROT|nr:DUF1194 domain-containing protein [Pseudoroseomonas rhizosphaerae]PHK95081.1 hypothetical protein CR162_10040 [Pseudoroseomonas rhizosphaerae]
MRRRSLLAAGGLAAATLLPGRTRAAEAVDVLLVLAVDVSRSVDEDEARLQREGYRAAMSDPKVVEALQGGTLGAIAITYVEWAGAEYQRQVLPWIRIGGQREANRWSDMLAEAPRASLSWTSISAAIDFSARMLAEAPFEGTRRVIDISGDGVNNSGGPVEAARDAAVAQGIVINGLPIINDNPTFGRRLSIPLDQYYAESVIGGDGAFLVAADDFASFGVAVRRKLIREIAGLDGPVMERA